MPVFSAMAHVILKEKLYNEEFIDERTENFEEFAASMEKFTPEYAEAISGVDRNLIVAGGAHVRDGEERGHLLGAGHPGALARHRQRPGADPPGAAHRAHRARGHRAESAARAEQRAGRLGFGRHALALPRLPAGGRRSSPRANSRRPGTSSRAG